MRNLYMATLFTAAALSTLATVEPSRAEDMIGGVAIIEKLDVNTLPRGKTYHFWFKAADTNAGQSWYVPVIVNRGAMEGPRLLLNAAIHGDELNGVRVVQLVTQTVDLGKLKGTIIGVPGLNISGIMHNNRNFHLSRDGGYTSDLNRIMPGDPEKGDAANRFAGRVWSKLWGGNVDYVVDMHTQSHGTAYPMYVWADPRNEKARLLAEAISPDVIKYDPGEKGTVETEFVRANIPAVTFEMGRPSIWQQDMITRGVEGVRRVMAMLEMTGPATAATNKPLVGNETTSLNATVGGFVEVKVAVLDKVVKGQLLAQQMNAFGVHLVDYLAPHDGTVLAIGDEPVREPGSLVVRLIHWSPAETCKQGC